MSINATSRFAALNPPEFTANERFARASRAALFLRAFQAFRVTASTMQYRFTRERSLVAAQPCPSGKNCGSALRRPRRTPPRPVGSAEVAAALITVKRCRHPDPAVLTGRLKSRPISARGDRI
jgi:hypothetical protein